MIPKIYVVHWSAENISKVGTQAIIGSQINFKFKDQIGILPIIANNFEGYKSIIGLSSKSYLENKTTDEPHCSFQELLNIKSGVTILSGSFRGLIGNLFAKNLLTEIDEVLIKLVKELGKVIKLQL